MNKVDRQFEVGDVVELKSGGPPMTVTGHRLIGAVCTWLDSKWVAQHLELPENAIKSWKPPPGTEDLID